MASLPTTSRPDPAPVPSAAEEAARRRRLKRARLQGRLAYPMVRAVAASYRTEIAGGAEHLDRIYADRRPAILVIWHDRLMIVTQYLLRRTRRSRWRLALLVSMSRDGELASGLAPPKFDLVRGSTSRGGLAGLFELQRMLTRRRVPVLMATDGPRGPAHEARRGAIVLAQLSGAPIIPISGAADRAWRLGSWDRTLVPKPFSRVRIAVGEPFSVARDADREVERQRLEERLDALTASLERAAGAVP